MADIEKQVENRIAGSSETTLMLKLYITGAAPSSARAIANIKLICETYLNGNYDLEIIDVYQQPNMTEDAQIIALPTLVKSFPLPRKTLIGDMSNTPKVLEGLGINN